MAKDHAAFSIYIYTCYTSVLWQQDLYDFVLMDLS